MHRIAPHFAVAFSQTEQYSSIALVIPGTCKLPGGCSEVSRDEHKRHSLQPGRESSERGPVFFMTIAELIERLKEFPADMPVKVFCPFDDNGPCTWEEPHIIIAAERDELRISP